MGKKQEEKNIFLKQYTKDIEKLIVEQQPQNQKWKDQKEGIEYVVNPCYKVKGTSNLTKAQVLQNEINLIKLNIQKSSQNISNLEKKENYYLKEIEKLKLEFEDNKKKVIDEGGNLDLNQDILKEFK